ncbi:MAG: hypothetical protein LBJ72_11100 [Dysgonamonadaceae bacterium]|jgi:hypothetical protein|nr:hypothetical protein [Dysgonamonadaceae bacterium]
MIAYIVLIILFIVYLLFLWIKRPERKKIKYKAVSAGAVEINQNSKISLCKNIYDANLKVDGQRIDANDYDVYIVVGNSMSIANVHEGDFVLVKDLIGSDKYNLASDNILLFEIDRGKDLESHCYDNIEYKLRQFITYVNGRDDFDNWFSDKFNNTQYVDIFRQKENIKQKYDKCIEKYNQNNNNNNNDNESIMFLLSKTYNTTTREINYSFHPIKFLKGVVKYVVDGKDISC